METQTATKPLLDPPRSWHTASFGPHVSPAPSTELRKQDATESLCRPAKPHMKLETLNVSVQLLNPGHRKPGVNNTPLNLAEKLPGAGGTHWSPGNSVNWDEKLGFPPNSEDTLLSLHQPFSPPHPLPPARATPPPTHTIFLFCLFAQTPTRRLIFPQCVEQQRAKLPDSCLWQRPSAVGSEEKQDP